MPQSGVPFSLITKSLGVAVTSTASASQPLANTGNTIRVYNEGPNVAFLAITVAATAAVATLPATTAAGATITSSPAPVGDSTFTIPNDQVYNISAICRSTQTATLTVQVNEGQ